MISSASISDSQNKSASLKVEQKLPSIETNPIPLNTSQPTAQVNNPIIKPYTVSPRNPRKVQEVRAKIDAIAVEGSVRVITSPSQAEYDYILQ